MSFVMLTMSRTLPSFSLIAWKPWDRAAAYLARIIKADGDSVKREGPLLQSWRISICEMANGRASKQRHLQCLVSLFAELAQHEALARVYELC